MRKLVEDFWKGEHLKTATTSSIRRTSGGRICGKPAVTWIWYKENMYAPMEIERQQYYLETDELPLPHPYLQEPNLRSYRELPMRYAERGTVYRYERCGRAAGLLRVRGFTQDDAHHFCRPDQMPEEIDRTLRFSPAHAARISD